MILSASTFTGRREILSRSNVNPWPKCTGYSDSEQNNSLAMLFMRRPSSTFYVGCTPDGTLREYTVAGYLVSYYRPAGH